MAEPPLVHAVDDDEAVLLSMRAILTHFGRAVACYESAERFLAEARADRPGCVVTDLRMPGMSGLDLFHHLARANSPLAVVVATGLADAAQLGDLVAEGRLLLLEKPYVAADLVHVVEQGLAASVRRASAGDGEMPDPPDCPPSAP